MKSTRKYMEVRRGSIFYADLSGAVGSEQDGIRPVLIIQNDAGNKFSPTVIAAAITSKEKHMGMPTHIVLGTEFGLRRPSIVMLEQIRTIDKTCLGQYVGQIDASTMRCVENAVNISLGQTVLKGGAYNKD